MQPSPPAEPCERPGELQQQFDELLRDHAKLREVLESVTDSLVAVDREWRITYLSRRALSKMGLTLEQAMGRNLWELSPESVETDFYREYHRVMRDRVAATFEMHYPPLNAWYDVHVYPTEQGLAAYVFDITARKMNQVRQAVENAVRASSEILNHLPDAVVLTDLQGVISTWTGSAERIFGYSAADAVGRPWTFVQRPDIRKDVSERARQALGESGYFADELACIRKDGFEICVESKTRIVDEAAGAPLFLVGIHRDVTQRKRMEEQLRRSEAQLAEAQEIGQIGSWEWDLETSEMTWSHQLYRDYGVMPPGAGASYQVFLSRIHPEDAARVEGVIGAALRSGEPFQQDYRILRPGGAVRHIHARGRVLRNKQGEPVRMAGTAQDISERKEIEAEIRRLNVELEVRVAQRTAELEHSLEDLKQFAYISSHDLQEPLRTIASYTQLLAARYQDRLDSDADEFIHYIVDASHRMSHLISDVLAYSRITNLSGIKMRRVSMAEVARVTLSNLAPAIAESGATIEIGALPKVLGEEAQLVELLQHLIDNAIKYRSEESPLISVLSETQSGWHHFAVRDNGIGVDPIYFERIFGLFKRLHGREVPGTGLGLAICKKIVEKHGGAIWVTSTPNRGSIFHFKLRQG